MKAKELKEALSNIPDEAEVLLYEAENWQFYALNQSYRLDCEYLYSENSTDTILFLKPI